MSLYRIKQFIWAILSFSKKIDDNYVRSYLNNKEFELFNQLNHNDKHHSIRVCKDVISTIEQKKLRVNSNKAGKAALLHDVGKIEFSLNLFEKSIIVVLDRFTKGKISKYNNIKHIDIYYNHPKIGVDILQDFNYDKDFLDTIRYHHNNHIDEKNELLNIIRICDNKN